MGYGTAILAQQCNVLGVDADRAAIAMACEQYPGCDFETGDIQSVSMDGFEAFVSFETLEHLVAPAAIIDRLPASVTDIVVSAPIRPTVGWNPWHRTDFTHGSFCSMIEHGGFRVVHVMGQPWVDGNGDLYLMVHGRRGLWTL